MAQQEESMNTLLTPFSSLVLSSNKFKKSNKNQNNDTAALNRIPPSWHWHNTPRAKKSKELSVPSTLCHNETKGKIWSKKEFTFETKDLLSSLNMSFNSNERKNSTDYVYLRPSLLQKIIRGKSLPSKRGTLARLRRERRRNQLETIKESEDEGVELDDSFKSDSYPTTTALSSSQISQQQSQSCAQQHQAIPPPPTTPDFNITELASYFDLYLQIPKKMSPMAEMMYT